MFRNHTTRIAAALTLLSTAALPQTAFAAPSYLDTVQRGTKTVYTTSLADITGAESRDATRTLDWQRPSIALFFDLPPAERTSEIVLTLSADPLTRVAKNSPLQVQFNDSKPVPVRSNGRGFEARLPFDATKSRGFRNVIRITYPAPSGSDCVTPSHGAWSIDLTDSTLRIGGRAKKRRMSLSEISDFLEQPALSPKKVGLIARGPNGTDMQALAAQGIALRTPGLPNFSVTPRGNDFNVVMVKRDRLASVTNDKMVLNSEGARIFVPSGRPTELIFTADTDAEIVRMLEIFATRELPTTRRPITSLGEINLQNRLDSGLIKIDKKSNLIDLAVPTTIGAGAQSYKFGALDPAVSSGEIRLHLTTTDNVSDKSRLSVALNGKVLGAAKLNKKRKTVAFEIKPGTLNSTSNILNIVPELSAERNFTCETADSQTPEFFIGERSRLTLNESTPSPVTELSRLTSTGGLFAKTESYIALPKKTRDYQAALRILGRMAKSAGHGLTLADYTRDANVARDKHVLIIGPSEMTKSHLTGAPKAFRDALSGSSSSGDNLLQANFENFASAGTGNSAIKYAASKTGPRRISYGGVAALYGSGNGNLTGIISTTPGQSFVQSSSNLVKESHWNALQGGVARWTSSTVVMTQTAQSDAGITVPITKKGFELPDIGVDLLDFEWTDFEWPEFEWPEIEWPEFDMPQVSLPEWNWPTFKSEKTIEAASPIIEREVHVPPANAVKLRAKSQIVPAIPAEPAKLAEVKPRLKPLVKTKISLRGPFQYNAEKPTQIGSFEDFRNSAKVKWFDSKRWFKAKMNSFKNLKAFDEIAQATDRLQDRVTPAGRSTKVSLKRKGVGLIQIGERTVSVYGMLLIMAFAIVLLMMSLARPSSRLGGRH